MAALTALKIDGSCGLACYEPQEVPPFSSSAGGPKGHA